LNAAAGKREAERAHAVRFAVGVVRVGRVRERLLVGEQRAPACPDVLDLGAQYAREIAGGIW
jgi:hypothetical protein